MISNYTIRIGNKEKHCQFEQEEEVYLKETGKTITVDSLLSIVNEVVGKNNDDYCIEAVVEFEYKELNDEFDQNFVEGATKKLIAFNRYDRKLHTRENLMSRLVKLVNR